ncbi:hypothetical protein [Paenibacillus qinlingensis]|uniref:Nucleoside 2-deoxyribosyltransferase n=1 Tax=Paenibacillus qinlingensis TaxID=1837343 RepID=A0ABU1P1Z7_9BACL|nr:hypothetical protein [Paenibacillus qinlingensis]MDR6553767.1 hypothetical protein [Paenibacillus qinlingensis]
MRLLEFIYNDFVVFDFEGYDTGVDLLDIIKIIRSQINPEKIEYIGITDMKGYFIKNNIKVLIEHNQWTGNTFKYEVGNEHNIEVVRQWANTVFNIVKANILK